MENKRHKYSQEEIDFLKSNVKGTPIKELTEKFNQKFDLNVNLNSISAIKYKYRLKTGINPGRYVKGNIPYYFGTKGLKKANSFSYKQGNIPHNIRPIGSERIIENGFIEVKIKNPDKWKLKHHVIYEQKHGQIKKGEKLIFLDGNKNNFNIENLHLISNSEQIVMSRIGLKTQNTEITKVKLMLARLIIKMAKLKNKKLK